MSEIFNFAKLVALKTLSKIPQAAFRLVIAKSFT